MPVVRRNAWPKVAAPTIETGGNTRYVPTTPQPETRPARNPKVLPKRAKTDPADANSADSRRNPKETTKTPTAATANAIGAARPNNAAAAAPVTDIASVGAITPIDSDDAS